LSRFVNAKIRDFAMKKKMRCAIGGISHETNTFSSLRTEYEDFHVTRGQELQLGEYWSSFEDVEWIPTLLAGASPHGMVSKDAYLKLREELLSRLSHAMPLDGVYMGLHGAMEVEEIGDGESDLVKNVREVVGEGVPIAASLDLHGNIASVFAQSTNVLTALRTAPHTDGSVTQRRAVNHLVRCVKEGLKPSNVLIKIPLLLPGEYAVTEIEPARFLYAKLPEIESQAGIMDASILIGCAWTDSPYTSVSVIVVAEDDDRKAHEYANSLANEIWARRGEFKPDVETVSVEEAIRKAMGAKEQPVFISDSGDNVTAGGAGDITIILEKLLELNAKDALVAGISDADAVKQCIKGGIGTEITLKIGGKLDKISGYPLEVAGVIEYLNPPALAVLKIADVRVILTSDRRAFTSAQSFQQAKIDPLDQKIVVVKLGYLFTGLRGIAKKAFMALSPGFTTLMLDQLPYKRIIRPIFPLDGNLNSGGSFARPC
jgi:microcystin degradation protein MlrC